MYFVCRGCCCGGVSACSAFRPSTAPRLSPLVPKKGGVCARLSGPPLASSLLLTPGSRRGVGEGAKRFACANHWAPLTHKRHTMPPSAQPRHTNHWAPRTRKRHQQEHRPQRPTERNDPTQHAKGRTGDCPGPRKETTTKRNVTQGGGGSFQPPKGAGGWERVPHDTPAPRGQSADSNNDSPPAAWRIFFSKEMSAAIHNPTLISASLGSFQVVDAGVPQDHPPPPTARVAARVRDGQPPE